MQTYRLTLQPLSALGTPLAGDTLFGQLCWTLRHQLGNDTLTSLLEGYTQGQPFAVVSDALPQGLSGQYLGWVVKEWNKSGRDVALRGAPHLLLTSAPTGTAS